MSDLENTLFADEVLALDESPFYEKWSKGRPSKEQLKKRELHNSWFEQRINKYPYKYPMLNFLMGSKPHPVLMWSKR